MEINPEYSLERLILKLKLQYFGHLMWRADSLEKTLMLGKTEGRRRRWQRMRWLDSIINSMDMNLNKHWGIVKDRGVWYTPSIGLQRVGHDLATEPNWTGLQHFRTPSLSSTPGACSNSCPLSQWCHQLSSLEKNKKAIAASRVEEDSINHKEVWQNRSLPRSTQTF